MGMDINQLLAQKNMTRYRFARQSGIPQTTMTDICSGKAQLKNCSGETLYRISKTLGVSIESLIADAIDYRTDMESYKREIDLRVKNMGSLRFIIDALESDEIRRLYDKGQQSESMYLLAMLDYLSIENDLPVCADYAELRRSIPNEIKHSIVESEAQNAV
jgi:transcriptional regulator with XRE-family HTH domain